MKAVVLHGSPRKGKNSDTLVNSFLKGFNQASNHSLKHFYLNEMKITPCQGCLLCEEPPHSCWINDDMQHIYEAYKESDLIVWASPMYWGYITAQLKLVQDRMESLAWESFENKIFVVLLTYRHHFQSAAAMFQRIAPHFNIDLHILECCTYDKENREDIPIEELPEKIKEAFKLGLELGKSI